MCQITYQFDYYINRHKINTIPYKLFYCFRVSKYRALRYNNTDNQYFKVKSWHYPKSE